LSWSSGIPHFLDYIEMAVAPEKIRPVNRVVVRTEEPGATVTAVKLVLSDESGQGLKGSNR
jgi:hypothetical protein